MSRLLNFATRSYKPLRNNPKFTFANQHALSIYRSNAICTYIPKNACSTLRLSVAMANQIMDDAKHVNWIHNNNRTFMASLKELAMADYTFVFLRCPYRRIVSCFLDKIVGRNVPAWNLVEASSRTISLDHLDFEAFVDSMSKPHILNADYHWRPQSDFLIYKKYDDIFCLENYQVAERKLKEKIDFQLVDSRPYIKHDMSNLEVRTDVNEAWKINTHELLNLRNNGETIHPELLYNDKLRQKVGKIYESDISLYIEYCDAKDLLFN